jgi:hypothetical protein
LPGCDAVTEQLPKPTSVRAEPPTRHTDGVFETRSTGRPELAVALSVNGAPYGTDVGGEKEIDCGAWHAEKVEPESETELVLATKFGIVVEPRGAKETEALMVHPAPALAVVTT